MVHPSILYISSSLDTSFLCSAPVLLSSAPPSLPPFRAVASQIKDHKEPQHPTHVRPRIVVRGHLPKVLTKTFNLHVPRDKGEAGHELNDLQGVCSIACRRYYVLGDSVCNILGYRPPPVARYSPAAHLCARAHTYTHTHVPHTTTHRILFFSPEVSSAPACTSPPAPGPPLPRSCTRSTRT